MSCSCSCIFVWVLIPVAIGIFIYYYINTYSFGSIKLPDSLYKDGFYGLGAPKPDDTRVYPYQYKEVSDAEIQDLKERLNKTRFNEALEDSKTFEYGFNPEYLVKVVDHWSTKYDWRKHENKIKSLNHFQTQIEGINVHFIHVKPKVRAKKVVPVLLVNGWPSNFYEYIHVIEKFEQDQNEEWAYELVIPSIPGYGFSEQPHKKGFNGGECARVFSKLMGRLDYDKYYVHGSDWGSMITRLMAAMYPSRMLGYHTTTAFAELGGRLIVRTILSRLMPSLMLDNPDLETPLLPEFKKVLAFLFRETGYMHIQSTRPDTVATGLNDSPAGLAAYILEKYCVWTNPKFLKSYDGSLTTKYDLDDLLTIISLYWFNKNINYSQRLYKEHFSKFDLKAPIRGVATGYTDVAHGLLMVPKSFHKNTLGNIVYSNYLDDGGHFFALENPKAFTNEIVKFINTCERLS